MYTAKGTLVIGTRGRELVFTSERSSSVAYAALSVSIEELLRRLTTATRIEERLKEGAMVTVSVVANFTPQEELELSRQQLVDAKAAEDQILAAELREGELGTRWTVANVKERTDAKGG
jgi:hypothetical protein